MFKCIIQYSKIIIHFFNGTIDIVRMMIYFFKLLFCYCISRFRHVFIVWVDNKIVNILFYNDLMLEFDREINKKLVSELNKTLKQMNADYKDLSAAMYHLDNSFAYRILHNQNIMRITTLIKVCDGLKEIREKNHIKIDEQKLKPSYFLSKIGY